MREPIYKDSDFCIRLNDLIWSAQTIQRKTLKEISDEMSISISMFTNYKYGSALPGAESLIIIADYFGVSIDYLLGREGYELEEKK